MRSLEKKVTAPAFPHRSEDFGGNSQKRRLLRAAKSLKRSPPKRSPLKRSPLKRSPRCIRTRGDARDEREPKVAQKNPLDDFEGEAEVRGQRKGSRDWVECILGMPKRSVLEEERPALVVQNAEVRGGKDGWIEGGRVEARGRVRATKETMGLGVGGDGFLG